MRDTDENLWLVIVRPGGRVQTYCNGKLVADAPLSPRELQALGLSAVQSVLDGMDDCGGR